MSNETKQKSYYVIFTVNGETITEESFTANNIAEAEKYAERYRPAKYPDAKMIITEN